MSCKSSFRAFSDTLHQASHTRFHLSSFLHSIWLLVTFFIIFQTFSMGFMSDGFRGHSRMGIHLHSRNVLVLFRVMAWHEIIYRDISLPWEHNTFTFHFKIINNITLVLCIIHVIVQFSQKRQASAANGSQDLHTYLRFLQQSEYT